MSNYNSSLEIIANKTKKNQSELFFLKKEITRQELKINDLISQINLFRSEKNKMQAHIEKLKTEVVFLDHTERSYHNNTLT